MSDLMMLHIFRCRWGRPTTSLLLTTMLTSSLGPSTAPRDWVGWSLIQWGTWSCELLGGVGDIYVGVTTSTHPHKHTPTQAHTHASTHLHMYTPTRAHTHVHTHTCTLPHMYTPTQAHTHTCTHPHKHTPTHVHPHMYIHILVLIKNTIF